MTGRFHSIPIYRVLICMLLMIVPGASAALEIPQGLETVFGDDGSVWEMVNQPGFGDRNNIAIVALCPFQENLYAITRNDETGFELWKTSGTGWEQLTVPGFTDNRFFLFVEYACSR